MRRWFFALGVIAVVAAAAAVFFATRPSDTIPFTGAHQAGIATPAQKFAFVAAFDVTTDAAGLKALLQIWSSTAERLTQGLALADDTAESPPADTGEVAGYKPARLTVTLGAGPSLFDSRFGLADRRPAALVSLPTFAGDNLDPQASNGDLVVQVCADDFETAYHAVHNLTRLAKGKAVARWVQSGFQPGLEVNPKGPGRNLQGFLDGTVNPDASDPKSLEATVWADGSWMNGGSYLVVRKIRMFVETWDRSSLADQETVVGRERATGKELASLPEDSHVRLARGDGTEKLFRRPYHYVDGLDPRTGQWDAGLLFLAWMKDPVRQFVPIQTRLSASDALNEYIQVVGSAVFAVFPGVAPGGYLGSGLFPEPTASQRLESLEAALGALFPALNQGDVAVVRSGADAWSALWATHRSAAGRHTAAIDEAADTWLTALKTPDVAADVSAAQSRLAAALAPWRAELAAPASGGLSALRAAADTALRAAEAGDWDAARRAFSAYQSAWSASESEVRRTDADAYGALEVLLGTARRSLSSDRPDATGLKSISDTLAALSPTHGSSGWDVALLLFREGLEALLVLAALLAFVNKTGQLRSRPWVWSGAALGLATSLGVAGLVAVAMAGWAASAPEAVEGIAGLVAVALMLTAGLWLHGKARIVDWNTWLKERMGRADRPALAALAFLAVLREGGETLVFFWGLAPSLSATDLLWGAAAGLSVLAVLGVALLGFAKRLPLHVFFPVATGLLYLVAAKVFGQSLGALQALGWLPATPLGWGQSVAWLGFSPTWESAVPQLALALGLAASVLVPVIRARGASAPRPRGSEPPSTAGAPGGGPQDQPPSR